ncbi:MAG TPA: hypothetical protein PK937_14565 [bacterium]|nr:hypothetical protein [bacterium]HMZ04260.1 hypothetical protein [bacterium]HNB10379.1 hypothetical protein [bacterium]HNH33846.1 hypothetical protein [bacterium]
MKTNFLTSLHPKILYAGLVLSSLIGYLEWGSGHYTFLVQAEFEIIRKFFTHTDAITHPMIALPLLGQALLLVTLFQNKPRPVIVLTGLLGLGVLLWFIFLIGLISLNLKITFAALPFLIVSIIVLYSMRKGGK